ncbi:MAG: hypothetical protein JKY49_13175 [Cohaesibacteraceae bacterium]|nr:hypothetical protein [Cohaesibacteraceae bacterium]
MIRVIIFFAVLFALAIGATWLADRPGVVDITWQGYVISTSLMTALVAILGIIVSSLIVWSLLRHIWQSPKIMLGYFQSRKRDKGYRALSRGFLAIGADDRKAAHKHALEAQKLVSDEPMTLMLAAQTAQLHGDTAAARQAFEVMLEVPETRALGLRGLFIEAQRHDEPEAARHFASEAFENRHAPLWAGLALFDMQTANQNWQGALKTLARNLERKHIDKNSAKRMRAVLLTGQGLEMENPSPQSARTAALEAHRLAPGLVPASLLAARLLVRLTEARRAGKIILTTWKLNPHPDLAHAYANLQPGASAQDKLKRTKTLTASNSTILESRIALATVLLKASEWKTARTLLEELTRTALSQRICLLMADLEESEHGDPGRAHAWMARAIRAARDPQWIADGMASDHWAPVSPVTGKLDAFNWTIPAETTSPAILEDFNDGIPLLATASTTDVSSNTSGASDPVADIKEMDQAISGGKIAEPVTEDPIETSAATAEQQIQSDVVVHAEPANDDMEPEASQTKPSQTKISSAKDSDLEIITDVEFPLSHVPDDPGPESEKVTGEPKQKFKLF